MMNNPGMQSVVAQYLTQYCQARQLKPEQAKVLSHIQQCRTPVLGGLQWQCEDCDYQRPFYHSCRNRHCPQCQKKASQQWCERQRQAVLPVSYFHTVFTLPHELNGWVELHPETIYALFFKAVWSTLSTFGADPKRLGGQMGMSAILHTWGQNLSRHVHLHCLIPGGALNQAGQWIDTKSMHYLFADKALARYFRGKMLALLRQAYQQGKLHRISRDKEMELCLNSLMDNDWIVYTKAHIEQADRVVHYLGRYSHRIAISDERIVGIKEGEVSFRYKDYKDGSRNKVMVLEATEFIRRFLLHVLPSGFMRIRHYGFLANRCRQAKLKLIRQSIEQQRATESVAEFRSQPMPFRAPVAAIEFRCPRCKSGFLKPSMVIAAIAWRSG